MLLAANLPIRFVIVIPALVVESPVRGACALANELSKHFDVTVVSLKGGEAHWLLDAGVDYINLGPSKSPLMYALAYKKFITSVSLNFSLISISFCFSADFVNFLTKNNNIRISSIRGDLSSVYRSKFGILGKSLAWLQYKMISGLDFALIMTEDMRKKTISDGLTCDIYHMPNFLDEKRVVQYRQPLAERKSFRFVFVGSLISLKKPDVFIKAGLELALLHKNVELILVGAGPLENDLKKLVESLGGEDIVSFLGFVESPLEVVSTSDILVLPSLTEGVSRAVMEALFLGVPCIMRNIPGARDLIVPGVNGALFNNDDDLVDTMSSFLKNEYKQNRYESLLPLPFSQKKSVEGLLSLLNLNEGKND
ncbi:glycosyltransferase [Aliamphritea ceti]|uniref:glycosyltransferase n=1 Tax=Aliamphritea ceti TaxID=1524258 RepID=UPI0021C2CF47|nr:glycosyltransferase [Aliamphritea ceti]